MQSIRNFIQQYTALTEQEWECIAQCLQQKKIKKGEILLKEGNVCRHLYFLESGLMRFFITKDGKDITKFFTVAPYCFTSQNSFTKTSPAAENIQALETSIIWQLTLQQANELLELTGWSNFIRKLIQEVQFYTETILLELQTETAENRYQKMLENGNQLLQRIPQKYLASYLGIAPQSLSRIRKNMLT